VAFIFSTNKDNNNARIYLGQPNDEFSIRGYLVKIMGIGNGNNNVSLNITNITRSDWIQFRWLQTSQLGSGTLKDTWAIDNIAITKVSSCYNSSNLLCETFNSDTFE